MKIKKGKLNYDQSGRAYPPNPRVKENWSCIWEYEGKYYKLVGDNEHKEWDEVNIYNQIIDESYENYKSTTLESDMKKSAWELTVQSMSGKKFIISQEEFINKCKTNPEFSEKWGLKIEERELSLLERYELMKKLDNWISVHYKEPKTMEYMDKHNIPTKLITLTYNNETIESYEY